MTGRENQGRRSTGRKAKPAPGAAPDPVRTVEAHADVAILVHELAGLLDGSMRWLTLALKSVDHARAQHADQSLDDAHRQLETAANALDRMADLVSNAMHGASLSIGSTLLSSGPPITIGECVGHASDVIGPEAAELGVKLTLDIPDNVRSIPAGPLYAAVLNGLRNAMDSIRACDPTIAAPGGTIALAVSRLLVDQADLAAEPWVVLTITDDGKGAPSLPDGITVFDYGFTTKSGGSGLGLAVARNVIRELHGTIELASLRDARDFRRPGAVLRIAFPPPTDPQGTIPP